MTRRILNPATVQAMVPLLDSIADDIERAYADVELIEASAPEVEFEDDLCEALDRVQACVTELERLGANIRSYSPVCVDFAAEVDEELGCIRWTHGTIGAGCFYPFDTLQQAGCPALSTQIPI